VRFAIALLVVAACTDEGPAANPYQCIAGGGAGCFQLPTFRVEAADSTGVLHDPVLDCAAFAPSPLGPLTINGATTDLFTGDVLPAVRVESFSDLALAARLVDVESDAEGAYTADIANAPNLVFERTTADGRIPTLRLYRRIDASTTRLDVVTTTKVDISAALVAAGDQFLPGKSQVMANIKDCAGNNLMNVIANIAPSTGKNGSRLFEPGVRVYYQSDFDKTFLRRTVASQTTPEGAFLATNLAPGHHFVQVWGFPTDQDLVVGSPALKLLAEDEIIVPDTESAIVTTEYGRL
jgi:hypothetical protein